MKNRHHLHWRAATLAAAVGILACATLSAQAVPLKLEATSTLSPAAPQETRPIVGETEKIAPRFLADTSISMGGNSLEIVAMDHDVNARLPLGEKLTVRIQYFNGGKKPVNVFALPYYEGQWPAGSKSKPSRSYKSGGGVVEQWFFFDQPALVDEIQVTMVDAASKETLLTLSLPVQMTWSNGRLRHSTASTPDALKY